MYVLERRSIMCEKNILGKAKRTICESVTEIASESYETLMDYLCKKPYAIFENPLAYGTFHTVYPEKGTAIEFEIRKVEVI